MLVDFFVVYVVKNDYTVHNVSETYSFISGSEKIHIRGFLYNLARVESR